MPDIIAAVATGMPGAIGILRLSGDGCAETAGKILRPVSGRPFAASESRKMIYCELLDSENQVIDMVLAFISRAPYSYTGEECCEIHCHGSPAVLREGLSALMAAGARPAKAGEFTKRAFLNGKMDLTAAEAVVDLIDAGSTEAARNASGQLRGAVYRKIDTIYENLLSMISRFQAVVDYPDEDVGEMERSEMCQVLEKAVNDLTFLAETFTRGTYLKNGVPCAIIGAPNSGKSTLLNALLGYDRAIVTEIAGTTRDTVEETVSLGGVRFRLADTAGIRESCDTVEKIGIERSLKAASEAVLVLLVLDSGHIPDKSDLAAMDAAEKSENVIALLNKCDLETNSECERAVNEKFKHVLRISAKSGDGLDKLSSLAAQLIKGSSVPVPTGEILTNARQYDAVLRARDSVSGAFEALSAGITPDAAMSDVELAMSALGEVTGRSVSEDIVTEIFSRFCVGK